MVAYRQQAQSNGTKTTKPNKTCMHWSIWKLVRVKETLRGKSGAKTSPKQTIWATTSWQAKPMRKKENPSPWGHLSASVFNQATSKNGNKQIFPTIPEDTEPWYVFLSIYRTGHPDEFLLYCHTSIDETGWLLSFVHRLITAYQTSMDIEVSLGTTHRPALHHHERL